VQEGGSWPLYLAMLYPHELRCGWQPIELKNPLIRSRIRPCQFSSKGPKAALMRLYRWPAVISRKCAQPHHWLLQSILSRATAYWQRYSMSGHAIGNRTAGSKSFQAKHANMLPDTSVFRPWITKIYSRPYISFHFNPSNGRRALRNSMPFGITLMLIVYFSRGLYY
jgi:hypothetical protein